MNDRPGCSSLFVELSAHLENGNYILSFRLDVSRKLEESIFHRVLESLFELLINFGDEFRILLLNRILPFYEHFTVGLDEFYVNHVQRLDELVLVLSQLPFLDIYEEWQLIKSLLNLGEGGVAYFFNFRVDVSFCLLELCDQLLAVVAFCSASSDKVLYR
jgi:hypothetical protein